jgi:hypothetical protein
MAIVLEMSLNSLATIFSPNNTEIGGQGGIYSLHLKYRRWQMDCTHVVLAESSRKATEVLQYTYHVKYH